MIKLNPYPYLAGAILLAALYGAHRGIVTYEVATAKGLVALKMSEEYKTNILKAHSDARKTTTNLQNHALHLEKTKDEKIKNLDDKLAVAIKRLSDRPSRTTTNNPHTVPDSKACSGSELYREDAEFLLREASRADALIIERDYYYNQYEDARKTLDEYSNSH
jgi:hypothetical protein